MRIPENNPNPEIPNLSQGTGSPKKLPGTSSPADSVQISSQALDYARLYESVSGPGEPTASPRLAALKEQIASGTYQADPVKIARNLVRETIINQIA
jgi:flagellar biosynthesis anti-sigma factor FlgM